MEIKDLQPREVFAIFDEITKIPRPSKKEEKIRQYLLDFAKAHNLESSPNRLPQAMKMLLQSSCRATWIWFASQMTRISILPTARSPW